MKRTMQKCFAVLLAIMLLCGSLPLTGLAAWPDGGIINGQADQISWTIDLNTSTVTFSGEGPIWYCPFETCVRVGDAYLDECIHTVVFSEGITEIHTVLYQFMQLQKIVLPATLQIFDDKIDALEEPATIELAADSPYFKLDPYGVLFSGDGKQLVWAPRSIPSDYTIPDGVEIICESAFEYNMQLRSIVIPDSVTTIGDWAFAFCSNVERVTLGDHLQTIGCDAFDSLKKVKQLHIPASVTSIGRLAFDDMDALQAFEVDAANPNYTAINGVLMDKAHTTICCYPLGNTDKSYTVPQGVQTIGEHAFSGAKYLESVTLPSSLRTVNRMAFFYSKKLSQITIPDGVHTIGTSAFSNCDALETITIPGTVDHIDSIFGSSKNLHTIILRNGVQSIDSYVFNNLPALQTVHIPSSVTQINASAFGKKVCGICTDDPDNAAAAFANEKGMTLTICSHEPACDAHDFVQTDRVEPGCTESGYIQYTCRNCGHIRKDALEPLGHDLQNWTAKAAYHTGVCARCQKKLSYSHKYEETVTTPATCTDNGEKTLTCTACGYSTTKEIPAIAPETGHQWKKTGSIPPTCEEAGEDTFTCTVCGAEQKFGTCSPGHMYDLIDVINPDPVTHTLCCAYCGKTITEPHKFTRIEDVPATCTADGYVIERCSGCGYQYREDIPATGHSFGGWVPRNESEHFKTCAACGEEQTEKHDFREDESLYVEPTETTDGQRVYVCTVCQERKSEIIGKTGEHSYVLTEAVEPTCTQDGYKKYICSDCGDEKTDVLSKLGHSFGEYVPDNNASCEQNGTKTAKCARCGATDTIEEEGTMLDHEWGEWEVSKPATPTERGEESRTCARCGKSETRTINTAEYIVRTKIMDTTGQYTDVSETTSTSVIGAGIVIAANPDLGFVLNENSVISGTLKPAGTVFEVIYDRVKITVSFWLPLADGTQTLYQQDEVYFGAMITCPPDAEFADFTITGWYYESGTRFMPHTAGTKDVNVYARIEPNPDHPASEEELAALYAAIAALPDPENLRYYTDNAILRVAAALGKQETDAAVFLTDAIAAGYCYEGEQTSRAVTGATKALQALTAKGENATADSLFAWTSDGGYVHLAARDESKAHADVRVEPIAVNGHPLDDTDGVSVAAGDRITFALRLTTDYFVSAADIPVVFDATRFYLVDQGGARYAYDARGKDDVRDAYDLVADEMISTQNVSKTIRRNYDVECYTVDSPASQYPESVRTSAFMNQYKIMFIEMMSKPSRSTKAQVFTEPNSLLCTFTLEARADATFDGSEGTVCVPEDWYADDLNPCNLFCVTRAAGLRADGTTPATNGSAAKYNFEIYDREAQRGQTVGTTGASISFAQGCGHDYVVIESVEPTATEDGYITYECTKCHETYTDVMPATGATLELVASKAIRGGTMDVQVNIRNNPGIVATRIWIEYDPEVLELMQVKNGDVFGEETIITGGDRTDVPYVVMWEDPLTHEDHTQDGTLGTLTFKVRADAPLGETAIRLFYDTGSTFNVQMQERPFNVRSTSVNVTRLYGDADFDGKLTTKDIVAIRTFLVGNTNESVLPLSMDFNRDGRVDAKDTTLLARHLVGGWD